MAIFNKDNKSKLDKLMLKNINEYIEFKKNTDISTDKDKNVFDEECSKEYIESVFYGVNYFRLKFTKQNLDDNECLELDLKDMYVCADEITKSLIEVPKLPVTIDILDCLSAPHFHLDGEIVDEAEYISWLPNYCCKIKMDTLCSFFKGLTIYEARDLLKQMDMLPEDSMLNAHLKYYDGQKMIHTNYFLSIIYMLLKNGDKYDIKRARIVADSLGIEFNFGPYEDGNILDNSKKKKAYPKAKHFI